MDAQLLYNQLLDEITEEDRALQRKRELAAFLLARIGGSAIQPAPRAPMTANAAADSDQSPRMLMTMPDLTKASRQVIEENGADEFVVGSVNRWLVDAGWSLQDGTNSKITVILKRLFNDGVLERTFEGAGNVPHKYRLARPVQDAGSAPPSADNTGS